MPKDSKLGIRKLFEKHAYIMDAKLLEFIEEADQGCETSIAELCNAFSFGEGAQMNTQLATEINTILFDHTENALLKLAIIYNEALFCKNDREKMIEGFHKTIDFMQAHIPMEEWDFSLFAWMEEYTQLSDEIS
jgi:hypothetical protein